MRFSLLADHKEFFRQNSYVEFDEVISVDEADALDAIAKGHPEGRDLWRSEPLVAKVAKRRRLALIGAELMDTYPLRLAFTDLIEPVLEDEPLSVTKRNSIQGLSCALIIRLSEDGEGSEVFPQKKGGGIFVHAKAPISLACEKCLPSSYLLVAYCSKHPVYILNERDPHTHDLKALGYGFGDRLRDETHPTLVKRQ
jgi:hypothetical protein